MLTVYIISISLSLYLLMSRLLTLDWCDPMPGRGTRGTSDPGDTGTGAGARGWVIIRDEERLRDSSSYWYLWRNILIRFSLDLSSFAFSPCLINTLSKGKILCQPSLHQSVRAENQQTSLM